VVASEKQIPPIPGTTESTVHKKHAVESTRKIASRDGKAGMRSGVHEIYG
jgi:hypothetical protein